MTSNPLKVNEEEVKTVQASGRPIKRRITKVAVAKSVYDRMVESDEQAAKNRARIQGLIDGNAPYDAEALKRLGQGWRNNVNYREAEAVIDTNAAAYWELFMDTEFLVTCQVRRDGKTLEVPGLDIGGIISEEMTRTLREWPDYYYHMMLGIGEMLTTGLGPMFWPDEYDWRFEALKRGNLKFPADTKSTLGKMRVFAIDDTLEISDLADLILDSESETMARQAGWNTTHLKKVLLDYYQHGKNWNSDLQKRYGMSDWENLQQALKNNDAGSEDDELTGLPIVHEFTIERTGKVTHVIFRRDSEPSDFLFDKFERFDSITNILTMFQYDIGNGWYRSVKGLGHRIYAHLEMSNRFINSTFDSARIASSLLLQPSGASGGEKARITLLGPITQLPEGFNTIQASFQPQFQHLAQMRYMIAQILNNNTGVYKRGVEDPNQPVRTFGEVQIQEAKEARFEKDRISLFYTQQDAHITEVFRRLTNPAYPKDHPGYDQAKNFIKRCVDRGIDASLIKPSVCRVLAARSLGFGSYVMRDQITQKLVLMADTGHLDQRGRVNAIRDRLAVLVGHAQVDRYLPMPDRDSIPTTETTLATLENNDLVEGRYVPVGVDQPHPLHAQVHLEPMLMTIKAFSTNPQSVNTEANVLFLGRGIQHMQEHVSYWSQRVGSEKEIKLVMEILEAASRVYEALSKQIEDQNAEKEAQADQDAATVAQARAGNQDPKLAMKLAEWQQKRQIEIAEANSKRQRKEADTQHRIAVRESLAQQKMRLAEQEAQRKANQTPQPGM